MPLLKTVEPAFKGRPAKAEMMRTDVPKPHEMISIDIGSMPKSLKGNCCFILCVDLCTKMINATALPNQTSQVLKEAFWEKHIVYYGVPQILVSDQGPNIDKSAIKELCDELGIEKGHSSPYHPQGNGSAERSIQTVKDRLRAMINDNSQAGSCKRLGYSSSRSCVRDEK